MKLVYSKEINIEIGQEFYGIIAVSNRTEVKQDLDYDEGMYEWQ